MTYTTHNLAELAEQANQRLADAPAPEIMRWAADTFGARLCVTCNMADAAIVHLAAAVLPGVDVVFLDTGYHFAETIGTRDAVAAMLPVNLINITPRQTVTEQDARYGPRMHEWDPDRCCALRKIEPLEKGLAGYDAWITGLRRDESPTRAGHADRRVGRQARQGEDLAHRALDGVRSGLLHRRTRRARQPAADGRLPVDRVRALHPAGGGRRGRPGGPVGGAGQDRVRAAHLRMEKGPV